ncbi:hypothetical protein ACIQC8_09420 [Agrococcus sediminis]|uniref:hypothetical protein n=1 Tax=Agrococcus sediminis TaxID=2599924 RepID=UPI003800FF30
MSITQTDLTRTDRVLLRVVQIGAWLGIALQLVSGVMMQILNALNGFTAAPLLLPVQPPVGDSGSTMAVVASQLVDVTVFVEGQPPALTAMMVGASIARTLGIVLVLLGVALLAGRMLRGRAFTQSAMLPLGLVLIGVAAGPTIADALEGMVSMATVDALGFPDGVGAVSVFNPGAIFVGLVVAALMVAFRIAGRLERETQGLV